MRGIFFFLLVGNNLSNKKRHAKSERDRGKISLPLAKQGFRGSCQRALIDRGHEISVEDAKKRDARK